MTGRTPGRGALAPSPLVATVRSLGVVLVAAILLPANADRARAQSSSGGGATTTDGIYTEEQARNGKEIYNDVCANCHPTSRFEGSSFLPSWKGAPVSTLYTVIRTQMPFDNPGSLDPEEYAAVVAYILELNDFPAGDEPLPSGADSLTHLTIQPRSGEGDGSSERR